jgi:hypothetical protein
MGPVLFLALCFVAHIVWCCIAATRSQRRETELLLGLRREEVELARARVLEAAEAYRSWEAASPRMTNIPGANPVMGQESSRVLPLSKERVP